MKWRAENRQYWLDYLKYLRGKNPSFVPKERDYGRTPEEARAWMKLNKTEYDKKNHGKIRAYLDGRRELTNEQNRTNRKKRRKTDIQFRLAASFRKQFGEWVKKRGGRRTSSYTKMIGCTFAELQQWIESHFEDGMTWDNQGMIDRNRRTWQIDHHYPVSRFNLLDPKHQKICFHYTNLYPMWARDNVVKRDQIPSAPRENQYIPDWAPQSKSILL